MRPGGDSMEDLGRKAHLPSEASARMDAELKAKIIKVRRARNLACRGCWR